MGDGVVSSRSIAAALLASRR